MDINEVVNNIRSVGYSKIYLDYDEPNRLDYDSLFPGLLNKITNCINNSDIFLCTKPEIIDSDVSDGFYLVESNHINFDVFMKRSKTWVKLDL